MKDYTDKKQLEKLPIARIEHKLTDSVGGVPWSCSTDGLLHFGAKVILQNKKTGGALVIDIGTKLPGSEDSYALSSTKTPVGPMARSVFIIERADPKDKYTDDIVHFGQKIRIHSNPHIFPRPVIFINS